MLSKIFMLRCMTLKSAYPSFYNRVDHEISFSRHQWNIIKRFASQLGVQQEIQSTGDVKAQTRSNNHIGDADKLVKSGKLIVYVDGACSRNGRKKARAGYGVFWGLDHPMNVSCRLKGKQTNNRAEYQAAICAVTQAITMQTKQRESGIMQESKGESFPIRELEIRTDSRYLICSVELWIKKWRTNGWQTTDGMRVKNLNDVQLLDSLRFEFEARGGTVRFVHVTGHSGEPGNEAADQLAKEGAKMSSRSRSLPAPLERAVAKPSTLIHTPRTRKSSNSRHAGSESKESSGKPVIQANDDYSEEPKATTPSKRSRTRVKVAVNVNKSLTNTIKLQP